MFIWCYVISLQGPHQICNICYHFITLLAECVSWICGFWYYSQSGSLNLLLTHLGTIRRQAINRYNAKSLSTRPTEIYFSDISSEENVCKIAAIWTRPLCVNSAFSCSRVHRSNFDSIDKNGTRLRCHFGTVRRHNRRYHTFVCVTYCVAKPVK